MLCHNCGGENRDDYKFCIHCGAARQSAATAGTVVLQEASSAPAYATPPAESAPKKGLLGNKKALITLGVTLVILCILGAVAVVVLAIQFDLLPFLGGGGTRMIVGFPSRRGETDLYLLRMGQEQEKGTLLVEEVFPGDVYASLFQEVYFSNIGSARYSFGGFVPGQNYLVYWYADQDGEITVNRIAFNQDTPTELLNSNSNYVWLDIFNNGRDIILGEPRDDEVRCYISLNNADPDRTAEGDSCYLTYNTAFLVQYEYDGERTTLTLMKLDGSDAVVAIDDMEYVVSYRVSDDGSRVAYHSNEDESQLFLVDGRTGEDISESDPMFNIAEFNFAPLANILYYIAENEDGEMELYIMDDEGSLLVTSGVAIGARFTDDGRHLAYLVSDEDGEETLFVYNISNGESTELATGQELTMSVRRGMNRLFASNQEEDDLTVYSANLDGSDLRTLYSDNNSYLGNISYLHDRAGLFLMFSDDNGDYSLFYTLPDREDGFFVLEEWADITLMNISADGSTLLFTGREDARDDPALYLVQLTDGADFVTLDNDADYYANGVFSSNNRQVIYTAVTGDQEDDVEILQVNVNGEEAPELLYKEAFIVDVEWASMEPFLRLFFSDVVEGSSYCPGAPTISIGDELDGNLSSSTNEYCYRFRGTEGLVLTFRVDADYDSNLTLYDRDGYEVDWDDDSGPGLNPRLITTLPADGIYFIKVRAYGNTGSYTISMEEGVSDPAFSAAIQLSPNVRTPGYITEANFLQLETFDWSTHGVLYYFEGTAGQTVIIDVFADSIGSQIDPYTYLFDPTMQVLYTDDDSGTGWDSQLVYNLPVTGRYYILVEDLGGDYGPSSSFFFDILLTIR